MRALILGGLPAFILLATVFPVAQADVPSGPRDLHLQFVGDDILLTWLPPETGEVDHYLVQRLSTLGDPVPVDAGTTEFLEAADPLSTLVVAYQVTAVFGDGVSVPNLVVGAFLDRFGPFCPAVLDLTIPEISADLPCFVYMLIDVLPEPYHTQAASRWEEVWALLHPSPPGGLP